MNISDAVQCGALTGLADVHYIVADRQELIRQFHLMIPAQKFYESLDWKRDDAYCEYGLTL